MCLKELTDAQIQQVFLAAGYVTQWPSHDISPVTYRAVHALVEVMQGKEIQAVCDALLKELK